MHNVLFLCTGNSARSIMAEALLSHMGEGRWRGFSAGSDPKGAPHLMTIEVLRASGLPTQDLRSKSWHEFAAPGAPPIDLVITVCGNAAGESCPVWPGRPITVHWGIEDPAAVEGEDQRAAFERALRYLRNCIRLLVALPDARIDELALRKIGRSEGASERAARDD